MRQCIEAHGPGNVVFAEIVSQNVTEVFTAFGRTGVRAEKVADEVVSQVRDYITTDVPVGPYLADQILLPLSISAWQAGSSGRSSFRTLPLSRHSTTHIDIVQRFLDLDIRVVRSADQNACRVCIGP